VTLLAWIALTFAGGAGSLARYGVDRAVTFRAHERFPYGILLVNVTGSFLLGLLSSWSHPGPGLKIVELGFIGGYTTFSTWMLDTDRLGEDGRTRAAIANVVVSVALGLGAAWLGRTVGGG